MPGPSFCSLTLRYNLPMASTSVELSAAQARLKRTQGQRLYEPATPGSLGEVVRSVCGVNAQRASAMMLSLRARVAGLERSDVEEAIRSNALCRSWTLRGTIHLHQPADLPWLVALLGPTSIAAGERRRSELGLTEDVLGRGLEEIEKALAGTTLLTRWELMDRLDESGLKLDRKSQAPIHLIRYAALKGLLAIGPDRANGKPTYGLFAELAGKKASGSRQEGLEELARRYLEGYGPVSLGDCSAWSGLRAPDARAGWERLRQADGLVETRVEGKTLWSLEPGAPGARRRVARLLPSFDSYLLGYSDRGLVVPDEHFKDVYRGGQTAPAFTIDGLVAGTWSYGRKGKTLAIEVRPFGALDRTARGLITREAEDVSRFMGMTLSLSVR